MDQSAEVASLRAALAAAQLEPGNAERTTEVLDQVGRVAAAFRNKGWLVESVIIGLRQILRGSPGAAIDEEKAIQYAIVQYYQ
jgi:hypothetical protein